MSLTTVDVIFEKSQLWYVTTNQRSMEGTSTVYTPIYNQGQNVSKDTPTCTCVVCFCNRAILSKTLTVVRW